MKLMISEGQSRYETDWKTRSVQWTELVSRMTNAIHQLPMTQAEYWQQTKEERGRLKSSAGGYVGGRLDGQRKLENLKSRSLITLDFDGLPPDRDLWQDITQVYEGAVIMHPTASWTKDAPRYRAIFPMDPPLPPEQYEPVARKLAQDIGMEGLDRGSFEPTRIMYNPVWFQGGPSYTDLCRVQEGDPLNPEEYLERYDQWNNRAEWPAAPGETVSLQRTVKRAQDPTLKDNLVGAFCRAYTIQEAMDTFIPGQFEKVSEGRYTYTRGTTSVGGAIILPALDDDGHPTGGEFLLSMHDHDPGRGHLLNAFDLVRIHLYGELDNKMTEEERAKPITTHRSYCAMVEKLHGDTAVRAQYRGMTEGTDMAHYTFEGLYTEQDMAGIYAREYKGELLYNEHMGWMHWNGQRWTDHDEQAITDAIRAQNNIHVAGARYQVELATKDADEKRWKATEMALKKLRSNAKIKALAELMRTELPLADVNLLDADPWKLNTPAGLIDLKTGELLPSDPAALCTRMTAVAPKKAPAPVWEEFLDYVTQGDRELELYLQRVAGMSAVGKVYEEGLVMVEGPGGNGKSTLFEAQAGVLADYACTLRAQILIDKGNGAEPFGMEAVRGCRLALMGELDEGARMNVSVMKTLTSRDDIQVNPKFAKLFTIKPTHTTILHTNHLPKLGQLDDGTRRRIAVVPLKAPPKTGKDRITDFAQRMIEAEGPQILQWIIEGAMDFWRLGCQIPKPAAVLAETAAYLAAEDWMQNFLNDRCELDKTFAVKAGELYSAYRAWCEANGDRYIRRNRDFTAELEKRGFTKHKTMSGIMWDGLKLATEPDAADDDKPY